MDVVYNHTNASGQAQNSVLDKIVPGYYHRLNDNGKVETSTCCDNTATEHAMMEKLMVDSLVTWATALQGGRLPLRPDGPSHGSQHVKVRQALDALTLDEDGVDGKAIYVYGEGWNFGEVANNARGVNATQFNLAGTGIGTFNDRLRDAVRGGGPFATATRISRTRASSTASATTRTATTTAPPTQSRPGCCCSAIRSAWAWPATWPTTSSWTAPARWSPAQRWTTTAPRPATPRTRRNTSSTSRRTTTRRSTTTTPTSAPAATSMADRVRMQNMGLSLVALSQGVPFFHAGSEILRSKSMDRDSYNSGDWFNKLDFTYQINNFGVGLPPAGDNQANWTQMQPLLAEPGTQACPATSRPSATIFAGLLQDPQQLAALPAADRGTHQGGSTLPQHRPRPDARPDRHEPVGHDCCPTSTRPTSRSWCSSTPTTKRRPSRRLVRRHVYLHPVQANGVDPVVKTATFNPATGTFTVPGRTTAVFVDFLGVTGEVARTPQHQPGGHRHVHRHRCQRHQLRRHATHAVPGAGRSRHRLRPRQRLRRRLPADSSLRRATGAGEGPARSGRRSRRTQSR